MSVMERIREMVAQSPDGTIKAEQVAKAGLYHGMLQKLVDAGELNKFGHGLYARTDVWKDEMFLLQRKYSRGIYSCETALYLHGYTDCTPTRLTMTFPKGYNNTSLKNENVIVKRVIPENYILGVTEIASPCGNALKVYDLERTLCDILRGPGADIQIIVPAMKKYADSKNKDLHKLTEYAKQLRVEPKIQHFMQVLL